MDADDLSMYCEDPVIDPRLFYERDTPVVVNLCYVVLLPPSKRSRVDDVSSWNDPDEAEPQHPDLREWDDVRPSASSSFDAGVVTNFLPNGFAVPKQKMQPLLPSKPPDPTNNVRIAYAYEEVPEGLCTFLAPHMKYKDLANGVRRYVNVSPQPGGGFQVQFWMARLKRHNRLATVTDQRVGALILAAATLDVSLRQKFVARKWLVELMTGKMSAEQWIATLESVA